MDELEYKRSVLVDNTYLLKTSVASKGNLEKWCVNNEWVKKDKGGYQDLVEVVVSDILQMTTLKEDDICGYELCDIVNTSNWSKERGCLSKNFLKENETLRTFSGIFRDLNTNINDAMCNCNRIVERFDMIKNIIKQYTGYDITEYVKKCLTLDVFFLNEDRHINNYGLIIANGKIVRNAPLFDNGLSLLSDLNDYKVDEDIYKCIKRVRASNVFSRDLHGQFVLLCKNKPAFKIYEEKFDKYLETNKEKLGRIYDILIYQKQQYSNFFIKENNALTFGSISK